MRAERTTDGQTNKRRDREKTGQKEGDREMTKLRVNLFEIFQARLKTGYSIFSVETSRRLTCPSGKSNSDSASR
jgi:hypothetical protein